MINKIAFGLIFSQNSQLVRANVLSKPTEYKLPNQQTVVGEVGDYGVYYLKSQANKPMSASEFKNLFDAVPQMGPDAFESIVLQSQIEKNKPVEARDKIVNADKVKHPAYYKKSGADVAHTYWHGITKEEFLHDYRPINPEGFEWMVNA